MIGLETAQDVAVAHKALDTTRSGALADRLVQELSGGERQRWCWRGRWRSSPAAVAR
jgi:ABC-type cobalamin/Fe3+-siderophores transport system ATPase subunit